MTQAGTAPVPVDPNERTYNIDPARIEAAIYATTGECGIERAVDPTALSSGRANPPRPGVSPQQFRPAQVRVSYRIQAGGLQLTALGALLRPVRRPGLHPRHHPPPYPAAHRGRSPIPRLPLQAPLAWRFYPGKSFGAFCDDVKMQSSNGWKWHGSNAEAGLPTDYNPTAALGVWGADLAHGATTAASGRCLRLRTTEPTAIQITNDLNYDRPLYVRKRKNQVPIQMLFWIGVQCSGIRKMIRSNYCCYDEVYPIRMGVKLKALF